MNDWLTVTNWIPPVNDTRDLYPITEVGVTAGTPGQITPRNRGDLALAVLRRVCYLELRFPIFLAGFAGSWMLHRSLEDELPWVLCRLPYIDSRASS